MMGTGESRTESADSTMECRPRRVLLSLAWAVAVGGAFSGGAPARAQSPTSEVMESAKRAAVMVRTSSSRSRDGDTLEGTGSGFFVNSTGLCITNNHVVDLGHHKTEAEKLEIKSRVNRLVWTVVTESGTPDEEELRADVLYQNEQADLAVLQVKDSDGELLETPDFLRLRPTRDVKPNLKAWCLGFPGGDARRSDKDFPPVAITVGNIVGLPRSPSGRITMIETDVLANPGNSGGPFIDVSGRLIGVLTLGWQTEARTNTTFLIPGDLVRDMIVTAFRRGKVDSGVDLEPFYDFFVGSDRLWSLPQFPRRDDSDCVTLDGGSRICGSVSGDTITWPTPLGDIEVPTSAMAYLLITDGEGMAFLDGGDRFRVDPDTTRVLFAQEGAEPVELDFDEVVRLSFRRPAIAPAVPDETAFVIGGADFHVSLLGVSGDVRFETALGTTSNLPVRRVERIETVDSETVLHLTNGSRMAVDFKEHELKGRLAWSGKPITFSFEHVDEAAIDRVNFGELQDSREIDLATSLATSDPRLVRIAKLLDAGDTQAAGPLLEKLTDKKALQAMPAEKRDEVRFLHGEYLLRSGRFAEAVDAFQELRRAKVDSVLWHSRARLALLDRYKDGRYENAPINEADVLERASRALAADLRRESSHALDGIGNSHPESRSEYLKLVRTAKKIEEQLLVANRLTAGKSDEFLVRLWRVTARLHAREARRLQQQRDEIQEQRGRNGPRGRKMTESQRRRIDQKITQIERDIDTARNNFIALRVKISEAGFIIDDPDYHADANE